MLETLKEIYYEVTGNYGLEITPQTNLNEGLGLSSFGKIRLICAVEDVFEIEVPNAELRKLKTVQNLIDLIERLKP